MNTTTMSKSAAIKAARAAVGKITRTGDHSYRFFAPYYSNKLDGPTSETHVSSYSKAVEERTEAVAAIALALMGINDAHIYTPDNGTTVDELVSAGMRNTICAAV